MPSATVLKRLVIWGFIALVAFMTCAALFADLSKVRALIFGIAPHWLAAILASVLFNYALRWCKWQYFLRQLHITISLADSLWVFFSAFTMVLSPGKVGEVVKSAFLKARYGLPIARTAPIVMAERLTDLLGLMILALIGSSRFAYGGATLAGFAVLMVVGMLLITSPRFWETLHRQVICRFQRLERFKKPFATLQESTTHLLSPTSLLLMTPLSAISWAGEGVALYCIFRSLDVDRPELLGIALFAHAFSSILGAVSFLPGGLLVTEGALGMFFVYVGIGKDQAVSATFLIRALTLWFAVIIGTFIFLAGRRPGDLAETESGAVSAESEERTPADPGK
jgi:uncharacterized protein (TIRG00374 family)